MKIFFVWLLTLALLPFISVGSERINSVPQEIFEPFPVQEKHASPRPSSDVERHSELQQPSEPVFFLPPLETNSNVESGSSSGRNHVYKIGVNRDPSIYFTAGIGNSDIDWYSRPRGGALGILKIASSGATALRTRLEFRSIPLGARIRFVGSGDGNEPFKEVHLHDIGRKGNRIWSPLTYGDTQRIEFRLPDMAMRERLEFNLTSVSHIGSSGIGEFPRNISDIGDSGSCNLDINCSEYPLVQQMADAVAKIVITDDAGSHLCSGTLVADTDFSSFIPYLFTASHCVDTEEQARSIQSFWFFESTACGSYAVRSFQTRDKGAVLLYTDTSTDVALVRLNEPPPAGAVFSGWDPNPLSPLEDVVGIHHPSGDLKKISFGQYVGTGDPNLLSDDSFNSVRWNEGVTEHGSSGSGLFTVKGTEFFLRGGLWGGGSSCSNPRSPDLYSRFDLAFPSLSPYLDSAEVNPETGIWWNPQRPGRGFSIEVRNGRLSMAAALYAEDGSSTWYTSSGAMNGASEYQGLLERYVDGQSLAGSYRAPVQTGNIGEIHLRFTASDRATLTWPGGTETIERFRFSAGDQAMGLNPETGIWWDPLEPGRGFFVEVQGDVLSLSGFMYHDQGYPVWYLASGLLDDNNVFQGNWLSYANGPTLRGAGVETTLVHESADPARLVFQSSTRGRLTLPHGRVVDLVRYVY